MITKIRKLVWCGLAAAAALAAADASYVGKWKFNVAKSDFGDTTINLRASAVRRMQMTVDGQTYTFKTDGKEKSTTAMFGSKMSWKATGTGAWKPPTRWAPRCSARIPTRYRGWQEPESGVQGDLAGGCAV